MRIDLLGDNYCKWTNLLFAVHSDGYRKQERYRILLPKLPSFVAGSLFREPTTL